MTKLSSMPEYLRTIPACLAVGYFAAQPYTGFTLLFVLLFLAVFFICGSFRAWKHPEERKAFFPKAVIWALWLILASSLHLYYFESTRSAGNQAVQALVSFNAKNGHFPAKLSEADNEVAAQAKTWRVGYLNEDGKPKLIYPDTFMIFCAYMYDFEAGKWVYIPG